MNNNTETPENNNKKTNDISANSDLVTSQAVTVVTSVWNADRLNLARDYLKLGKSLAFIAHELGVTKNNLKVQLHRHKIRVSDYRSSDGGTSTSLERQGRVRSVSIAERLMVLQGLKPSLDIDSTKFFFSDEELKVWIDSPIIFFKQLCNVELYSYQKDMLALLQKNRRICFASGRGIGKTYLISLFLLYKSIIKPGQKWLVIAPSDRQARILLEYMHGFIANNDSLFKSVNFKKTNLDRVTFTNESWISPLGSTSFLRGFQDLNGGVILDEAAYLENGDKIFASILPMIKSGVGQFIVSSTPNVVGDKFHQTYLNPSFVKLQIPSTVCPRYSKEDLELMEQDLSPHEYATEILAEFVEGSNNFFSPELISKCTERYDFASHPIEGDGPIFVGCDVGRTRDASVIVCLQELKDGVLRMVFAKELINTPLPTQVGVIKNLCETWKPKSICIESNGLSLHMVDELKASGLPVIPFTSSVESKQESYTFLLRKMEAGKVVIPFINRLQFQLRNFRYEVMASGKLKLHHSTEIVGDDWPDALNFAVWAFKKSNFRPIYRVV